MERRTKDEWDKIMANWRTSDLPMSSFCRENSINYWTFRENKKKREATTKASTKSKKLVRISPALKALEPEASPITIILPDNIKLLIPDHFNAKTLQKIISTLAAI